MRPATLLELAGRRGQPAPAIRGDGSFADFVRLYRAAAACVGDEAGLRRLVREVVEDAAADGATWLEVQFNPSRHPGVGTAGEVLDVVLDEATLAGAALGTGVGIVVSVERTEPPELAVPLAGVAADRASRTGRAGARVVGFGLAGSEAGWPPAPFAPAFALAREAGLLSVPHAGEHEGPASVASALDDLGAVRIAHGIRALEDPELVARLVDEGVVLDVCPTSNAMLGVVPSITEHPLPRLLAAGVRTSLNADDPLLFGPGLLAEYQLAREQLGLDDAALAGLARTSLDASGAPPELVASAVAGVDAWLSSPSLNVGVQ